MLRAGLTSAAWLSVDDTGARHEAANGVCTQIGNEHFAWFGTTGSKSRLNFLDLLRAGHTDHVVNAEALAYMHDGAAECRRGAHQGEAGSSRQARAKALMLLDRVGLADKVTAFPYHLSDGQQQRGAIARALAIKPQLMLFAGQPPPWTWSTPNRVDRSAGTENT